MNEVFVVSYFYPDGTYAGIVGVYKNEVTANAVVSFGKNINYPDCTFVVTRSEVE